MKNMPLIASLLAAVLVAGCKPSATDAAAKQLDEAQTATQDAAKRIHDYTFEQKSEFAAAMRAQLADLSRDLDTLSAKIETSSEALKTEAKPKLAALREQARQLNTRLDEIVHATPSTWSTIKADSERAYTSLKDGFARSRQWVSDKIAP